MYRGVCPCPPSRKGALYSSDDSPQTEDSIAVVEDSGREGTGKWVFLQTILSTMSVVLCRTKDPAFANPLQRAFETQCSSEQAPQDLQDDHQLQRDGDTRCHPERASLPDDS